TCEQDFLGRCLHAFQPAFVRKLVGKGAQGSKPCRHRAAIYELFLPVFYKELKDVPGLRFPPAYVSAVEYLPGFGEGSGIAVPHPFSGNRIEELRSVEVRYQDSVYRVAKLRRFAWIANLYKYQDSALVFFGRICGNRPVS